MGWFDSQIRERISNNKQQLQKAYWNLASVVMKETNETFADTRSTGNQNALTQICRYFHLEVNTVPDNIVDLEEQMERLEEEIAANATNSAKLNELLTQKEEVEQKLEEKVERWVYLNDLAEQIGNQE